MLYTFQIYGDPGNSYLRNFSIFEDYNSVNLRKEADVMSY